MAAGRGALSARRDRGAPGASWDRDALRASPRFAALHDLVAALPATGWSTLDALNAAAAHRGLVNAQGRRIRFVTATGAGDYEAHVAATGEVPTREGSWHDLFNALAWLAFPIAKAAINRLHGEHRLAARRGTARDVLTLFDEDGLVMATADASLAALLHGFQWRELFVRRRADVARNAQFLGFGHALHEKLLSPFRGLTAKVLVVEMEPAALRAPHEALRRHLDDALAGMLATEAVLGATRSLSPLPVQGIPGWWAANEDPAFYDDAGQFRPGRRAAPAMKTPPARGGV